MIAQAAALRLLPAAVYPATVIAVMATYLILLQTGLPVVFSTYAALTLAFASVIFFEWRMPYRREWKAGRAEHSQDLLFMTLIHLLFTKFLGFAAALWIQRGVDAALAPEASFWPHEWPVLAQGALMVLLVDLVRYWLHRACHTYGWLWRLHAVHHSPKRLYWLNVGRFHPVERAFQFALDSVPFMLMGVAPEVLGTYFLLFAANGLFQHCNIRLEFGVLNWVVSSADLHRWHHSKAVAESNNNYSNTTIVWDIVFGTRYLPPGRTVGELGLPNDRYPTDFLSQMRTPFIRGIESADTPVLSARDLVLNALLEAKMAWTRATAWRRLARAARDPAAAQAKVLRDILAANRDTEFGRARGFGDIRDVAGYRARVEVASYEDLRPSIEEQQETGRPVLTAEAPAMYNRTSGTTGAPKLIPLTASALRAANRLQKLFALIQYDFRREGFQGRLLGLVSPAEEGRLPSGRPFGSASGLIYRDMPRLARAKYVLPYEVFEIPDYAVKYYVILRLGLAEPHVTYLGSANPSTFLKMLEVIAERKDDLLADIRAGTCRHLDTLEASHPRAVAAVRRRLRADPARAAHLAARLSGSGAPSLADIWPHLALVTTWTGGSCGIALGKLRDRLPPGAAVFELGYLASELRGTVTVDGKTGDGIPTLEDTFFEFVEKADWEAGRADFLGLGQVEPGRDYYVFITTASGLYRYAMNDIVAVTGRFGGTPVMRFLQKGKGVTNITGEKLYESQAIAAVESGAAEVGAKVAWFQMLAEEDEARYTLYLEADAPRDASMEALARGIDGRLQALNLEYRAKREGGRLGPLVLRRLRPGAGEAHKRHCLAKGQREVQFKPMPLQYRKDFDMDLDAWA